MTHREADKLEIAAVLRWKYRSFQEEVQIRGVVATETMHTAAYSGDWAPVMPGQLQP